MAHYWKTCIVLLTAAMMVGMVRTLSSQQSSSYYGVLGTCANCHIYKSDKYIHTDGTGVVDASFSCSDSSATTRLCDGEDKTTVNYYSPAVLDVCKSVQDPIVCHSVDPVTFWGDTRMDPGYVISPATTTAAHIDGDFRDFDPVDFENIAWRGGFTPKYASAKGIGMPDIYAYQGTDVWTALYNTENPYPAPGTADGFPPRETYDSMPPFRNDNKKLFLYTGVDSIDIRNNVGVTTCDLACSNKRLWTYLTTHGGIDSILVPSVDTIHNVVPSEHSAAELTALVAIFTGSAFPCTDANTCFIDLPAEAPVGGTRAFGTCGRTGAINANVQFCRLSPNQVDLGLPTLTGDQSIVVNTEFWKPDGTRVEYPFLSFAIWTQPTSSSFGFGGYAEQSVDGVTWTLHPDSVSFDVYELWLNGATPGQLLALISTSPNHGCITGQSARIFCVDVLGVTGLNKYIRIVTVIARGTLNRNAAQGAANRMRMLYMPTMLHAKRLEDVELFVTPSLHNTDLLDVGYEACDLVPGCTLIPSSYGTTYPAGGVDALHGSPIVRAHMRDQVMPAVFGCKLEKDPIQQFLFGEYAPATLECKRVSETVERCYQYAPTGSLTTDIYAAESDGRFSVYHYRGATLTVTERPYTVPYPVPILTMGPIDTTNLTPSYHVYDTPVAGAMQMGNLYFSATEACTTVAGMGLPALPMLPTCQCSDIVVDGDKCLCLSQMGWKELATHKFANDLIPQEAVVGRINIKNTVVVSGLEVLYLDPLTPQVNAENIQCEQYNDIYIDAASTSTCYMYTTQLAQQLLRLKEVYTEIDTKMMKLLSQPGTLTSGSGPRNYAMMDLLQPCISCNTQRSIRASSSSHCNGYTTSQHMLFGNVNLMGLIHNEPGYMAELPLYSADNLTLPNYDDIHAAERTVATGFSHTIYSHCKSAEHLKDALVAADARIVHAERFLRRIAEAITTPGTVVLRKERDGTALLATVQLSPRTVSYAIGDKMCRGGIQYTAKPDYVFVKLTDDQNEIDYVLTRRTVMKSLLVAIENVNVQESCDIDAVSIPIVYPALFDTPSTQIATTTTGTTPLGGGTAATANVLTPAFTTTSSPDVVTMGISTTTNAAAMPTTAAADTTTQTTVTTSAVRTASTLAEEVDMIADTMQVLSAVSYATTAVEAINIGVTGYVFYSLWSLRNVLTKGFLIE